MATQTKTLLEAGIKAAGAEFLNDADSLTVTALETQQSGD